MSSPTTRALAFTIAVVLVVGLLAAVLGGALFLWAALRAEAPPTTQPAAPAR